MFAVDAPTPPAGAAVAIVDRVVDGDTIIVSVGGGTHIVRLLGIDSPEKPDGPRAAECFGIEATVFAQELLPEGTSVQLTRDDESRDTYGRLLAFVHRDDGLFVNLAMVEHGYATALSIAPNTSLSALFEQAADRARRDWVGFWAGCGGGDVALGEPSS